MSARIDWYKQSPAAYEAMLGLERALETSGLELSLLELLRLRASQLNGCAFCVNMHGNDARRAGETEQRLQCLSVWRDTGFFTPRERAALAWTESLTLLAEQGAPQAQFEALREHFTDKEVVDLTLAIGTINAWNRFGVGFALAPE
ncbi:carboxymuconolactone decarboxylase family protein [Pseudomonas benzenivorans]|uniref:Carboxymuconolactone decarboxylase family protein n=1 Tax=Pseudomonas benzenivorans TaxID=556533 RepID=A0ABZ0PV10_9PSED|nr:carboxymuconolactone decarboxylase family protein [Pseudomonas benzenivorans]WPC05022.1 carboxymuconolactone decarboxylase family protein [Pseudomonas benzenivorans]